MNRTHPQTGRAHAPLEHVTVEVVGAPFHAVVDPENGAVLAGGFATEADLAAGAEVAPNETELWQRLARVDEANTARGVIDVGREGGESDASPGAVRVFEALRAYDAGDVRAIDALPVAQPETPFRGEVWRALRLVPAGSPVTYTELAALAGRPSAVRAAASGCANNLVALIVPCHRIIRADGGLGGYLFGTDLKRRLLDHEAVHRA